MWDTFNSVSPRKASQKINTFFDIQIQQDDCTKKICVMANSGSSQNVFKGKCNSKAPVQLSGIKHASGTLLFNSNTGSRITELSNLNFKYKAPSITKTWRFEELANKKNLLI